MSALCFLNFNTKHLNYKQLNNLANDAVKNALLNGYAVFFNDSFAEETRRDEKLNTSVLLSDSFLCRNADDLLDVTDFAYEAETNYKMSFIKKYSFLSQLVDIIFQYEIDSIDLYITEQGDEDFNCIYERTEKVNIVKKLYDIFTSQSLNTGYTFPSLKVHIER